MSFVECENHDNGSLCTGAIRLQVGDLVEIEGAGRPRQVTYVMGSPGNWHVCFKSQGAVPVALVRWRRVDPAAGPPAPACKWSEASKGERGARGMAWAEVIGNPSVGPGSVYFRPRPWPVLEQPVLITGFDSAWTDRNCGALVSLAIERAGARVVQRPIPCSFSDAERTCAELEKQERPALHLLAIDQPLIVTNQVGRRPCERVIAHVISRFGGGVQPGNRGRTDMFGDNAPIWRFLQHPRADLTPIAPRHGERGRRAIEVFPALALLGLFAPVWEAGRLPKYNPARRKTFRLSDWRLVADLVAAAWRALGIDELADWCANAGAQSSPTKALQDRLDATICALVGLLHWTSKGADTLAVGDTAEGYIVVPAHDALAKVLRQDAEREHVMLR